MQGGISSGLVQVTSDITPKMYIVKGRRQPIVRQLPNVSWAEMNEGDVFVIDAHDYVVIWKGKLSNKMEQLQAAKVSCRKMCALCHY